jgi:TRAP-type uncharacterized transport system fused permease subunit
MTVFTSIIALVSWGGALTGYLFRRTTLFERACLLVSALALLGEGWTMDTIGVGLLVLVIVLQKVSPGKQAPVVSEARGNELSN